MSTARTLNRDGQLIKHCMFFCVTVGLHHSILVFLVSVVVGIVSSVPSREISWGNRLRNDLFFTYI